MGLKRFDDYKIEEENEEDDVQDTGIPVTVKMVILSHLSDVQDGHHVLSDKEQQDMLNFVKYLVMNYPNNKVEIDENKVYDEFVGKHGAGKVHRLSGQAHHPDNSNMR